MPCGFGACFARAINPSGYDTCSVDNHKKIMSGISGSTVVLAQILAYSRA